MLRGRTISNNYDIYNRHHRGTIAASIRNQNEKLYKEMADITKELKPIADELEKWQAELRKTYTGPSGMGYGSYY